MPGRAAEQDERAGDEAAAEHAVELADAGRQPRRAVGARPRAAGPGGRGAAAPPARAPGRRRRPARGAGARSSTSVFHSSQPGHCPCHFAATWPQDGADEDGRGAGHERRQTIGRGPDGFPPERPRATTAARGNRAAAAPRRSSQFKPNPLEDLTP